MSGPASRRGFLRGLTTLPLIGGSVALIGSQTHAAQPVTPGMLATYASWLHFERMARMHGCFGPIRQDMIPCMNPGSRFHDWGPRRLSDPGSDARNRAPIVLAAVGCSPTDAEAEAEWSKVFPGPNDLWLPA